MVPLILLPDFVDMVADWCETNGTDLGTCALACCSWTYAFQKRLFRKVTVYIGNRTKEHGAERLADILARSPHIGKHIQYILLDWCSDMLSTAEQQKVLADILPCMPVVQTLSLRSIGNDIPFSPVLHNALTNFTASNLLTDIIIHCQAVSDLSPIVDLMANRSRPLGTLQLECPFEPLQVGESHPTHNTRRFLVDQLVIITSYQDVYGLAALSNSLNTAIHVKSINIEASISLLRRNKDEIAKDIPATQLFTFLQELSLTDAQGCDETLPRNLNLSYFPQLHTLEFISAELAVCGPLCTVASSNVIETIRIRMPTLDAFRQRDRIVQLDSLLGSPVRFHSLKEVNIIPECKRRRPTLELLDAVKKNAHTLIARDILRLDGQPFSIAYESRYQFELDPMYYPSHFPHFMDTLDFFLGNTEVHPNVAHVDTSYTVFEVA